MHAHWKTIVALNVLLFTCCVSAGQSMSAPETDGERVAGYANTAQFGGPNSVGAQVKSDDKVKQSSYRFQGFTQAIQPYYDFKARTHVRRGLAFGADYNVLFQAANDSIGDDKAASGALRLFGNWTLTGRDSTQQGSLVFKVENRHRLGTDIAPQALASELGYAGLTATPFSDAGSILTNLYWHQLQKKKLQLKKLSQIVQNHMFILTQFFIDLQMIGWYGLMIKKLLRPSITLIKSFMLKMLMRIKLKSLG